MWDVLLWTRNMIYEIIRVLDLERYGVLDRIKRKQSAVPSLFGIILFYLSISMLLPLAVAIGSHDDLRPWIFSIALSGVLGGMLLLRYRSPGHVRPTEAMFIVAVGWLIAVGVGSLPFMLYGMGKVDALFESMSGFTTTGSTIMMSIESWPRSLLLWRSLTQWLGGAGIIMIFVTVFPILGVGGRNLIRGENFGGTETKAFSMRIKDEARKFHYVFVGLSLVLLVLLLFTGIGLYDALAVMFSTISTGGFSPHSQSIAFYNSATVEWIVIVFMFLGGTSFYLSYQAIAGRRLRLLWKSAEFRTYAALTILASLTIAFMLWDRSLTDLESSLRSSSFQVVSLFTSTGFATADYLQWDRAAIFILMALVVIGGSTGSTSGGLKVARVLLSGEFIRSCLYKAVHPRSLFSLRLDGKPLAETVVTSLLAVIMCYFITALLSTVLLVLIGVEPLTSMSAALTTLSNCGLGLGSIGPVGSFGSLPEAAKIVLMFTMWAGRLEFISVLVLMTPVFWRELLRYQRTERSP